MIYVVVLVVLVGLGLTLAVRHRPQNTVESGIVSFRREMRALAPPSRRRPPGDTGTSPDPEATAPDDRAPDSDPAD